jgi:myo-inositol-1(or 4)-monophosphatase
VTAPPRQPNDLSELLALAREVALLASAVHRRHRSDGLEIETKSSRTDLVSNVDREAEREIVERLRAVRPNDEILTEESGELGAADGEQTGRGSLGAHVRWLIDPLDGTNNYVHGYPSYCCSVAADVDGEPAVGVVSDSVGGGLFAAVAGGPATLDDRPIAVRAPVPLAEALVTTGFSYDATRRRDEGRIVAALIGQVADLRRSGSAALDLCRLAAGMTDAYFETDLAPWDYAAGALIARAAGAEVRLLAPARGEQPYVVAAHPVLFAPLVELLRQAGALAR